MRWSVEKQISAFKRTALYGIVKVIQVAQLEMKPTNRNQRDTSKFHWLAFNEGKAGNALYDTIIDETDNFAVLPTKGSIVPGWVLIVPKFPIARIADVPEDTRDELSGLVQRVSERLQESFGKVFSFEHGGYRGSQISCGVDQAHLHLTALDFDLLHAAQASTETAWTKAERGLIPHKEIGSDEYWFVSCGELALSHIVREPTSQFFRRLIAEHYNLHDHWDYRTNDFCKNVNTTLEKLSVYG